MNILFASIKCLLHPCHWWTNGSERGCRSDLALHYFNKHKLPKNLCLGLARQHPLGKLRFIAEKEASVNGQ